MSIQLSRRDMLLQDVWDIMSDNGNMQPEVTTREWDEKKLEAYIRSKGFEPSFE